METKLILVIISIQVFAGFAFMYKQNKQEAIGGRIAPSKLLWLNYTLLNWFFLPVVIYFYDLAPEIRIPLLAISCSMWIRGVIELIMLYIFKNWTPPIGMVHNTFTIILALFISLTQVDFNLSISILYLISLIYSLCCENYYAYEFYKVIGAKTKGEEGIWFANKEDPAFKKVILITSVNNTILVIPLLAFILKIFFFA
jgi:hypothetical protein